MTTFSTSKYAYPSNLNVANFVSLKLTSTNFLLWETQVISLIESQDLLGFITGTISAPLAEITNDTNDGMMPNPDLAAWTRTDRLIKAWITATISEEALGTVVGLTTSLDVWKALSNAYSQDSQAREFELLLKLQEKKKDTVPLIDFIRNFKLTCDQLNAIGKSVLDQKKVFWLLNGLGPRYESFSTAMLKPPVPSYLDLIPLLHSHELRNKSLLIDQPNPALAFVGQRFNSNKGSSFNSRGKGFHQSGSRPPYTPRNGHHHSSSKNNSQSGTPHPSQTDSVPHCQICKKRGHHALKCWHRFDNSYQDDHVPQALAALHLNTPTEGEWVPDTGATAHLTDDLGTPEQNSVAERKHRHVVELGLAMLLHASAPKRFWIEAFLIATFLINRLPSPSLGMNSPYFFLHQKKPTYDFLRTFGCQCFPYLRSYAKDKLEPRSLPCLFVGYSDKHKGYHCLHLSTGRVYTSQHVVFDETSFPFAPPISIPPITELVPSTLAEWISPSPAPPPKNPPLISPTLDKNHAQPPTSTHSMITRGRIGIVKPNPKYALTAVFPTTPLEPKSVKPSMHIIGCRWIFKTKLHSDGSLDRLKARLVAKGYNQQEGVDFLETFSPVIRPATICIILTLATVKGWSLRQLVVKNAFLHGHLDTTVFMDQPLVLRILLHQHVCQLKRALYGLKQAPRAWFDRFSSFLIDYGFFCSTADSSLFIYNHDSHILILLVYVDDIILTGSSDSLLADFVSHLGVQFSIKDLDLLAHTNMLDCKPIATPMASKRVSLSHAEELYSDITEYRRVVGVRILRHSSLDLFAFSDADWVGCPVTRRSTTGFCTFLGSNCISWSAKKQPTVSRSSTEAEYRATASTAAELTWVSFILRDIGIYQAQPPTLFCDNLSALHMSVNPILHARTKHIAIDYHFVREKVALGTLITRFVPSSSQLADLFTKPLSRVTFDGLKSKLGLWATPTSSLKGGKEEYPTVVKD
uniref:Uncharacterized protein n=1 Tax=Fagus sylvatica TaxID=28930 RepID=A0A2N9J0X7_FAGSY